MALTLSVKMVGLFLVAAIGLAVVSDLWSLMDVKRGLELVNILKGLLAIVFVY
jgi:dolichyl-phosphate-mannose-protein mannosyltransferase